ncbi:MAG: hypothetical protein Q7S73_01460 [bacterium]|nr:hypothetical protein [bacterium]
MTIIHNKQKFFLIALAVVVLTLLIVRPAFAEMSFLEGASLTFFSKGASVITYLIGYVGGVFVQFGGTLANWSLNLNSNILQSSTVKIGWVISRDLANLGFVLAIILISFATILRIESYAMKQTLWKLIAAALLVNFSLVIAGVFIDFSGVMTDFFISKATGGNIGNLGAELAGAFRVQNLTQPSGSVETLRNLTSGLTDFNTFVVFLGSMFFATFFTVIAGISLMGLSLMLFIRYVMLNILLVIMPIACLLWIWPETAGSWSKWWGEFFKWVWFAPATSLFVYLALALVDKKGTSAVTNVSIPGAEQFLPLQANAPEVIGQMIAVIGLLSIGLKVANDMGIEGAALTMQAAQGAKNMIIGAPIGAGKYVGGGVGSWIRDRAVNLGANPAEKKESYLQRAGSYLAQSRAVPLFSTGLSTLGQKINEYATTTAKEDVANYKKGFSNLSPDGLASLANSTTALTNPAKTAAIAAALGEKGIIEGSPNIKISDDRITELMKIAQKFGTDKEITKARPDLAKRIGGGIKKIVEKIKVKEADDISAKALENPEVFLSLSTGHIEQITKFGTNEQKVAIVRALKKAIVDVAQINDKDQRRGPLTSLNEKREFIKNNVALQSYTEPGDFVEVINL